MHCGIVSCFVDKEIIGDEEARIFLKGTRLNYLKWFVKLCDNGGLKTKLMLFGAMNIDFIDIC